MREQDQNKHTSQTAYMRSDATQSQRRGSTQTHYAMASGHSSATLSLCVSLGRPEAKHSNMKHCNIPTLPLVLRADAEESCAVAMLEWR